MEQGNITPELCEALSKLTYAEWVKVSRRMNSIACKTEKRFRRETLAPMTMGVTGAELAEIFDEPMWGDLD